METVSRTSIRDDLNKYDYLKNSKELNCIEVTEWFNKEGIDISIECKNESKLFSLSYGELDAINYLSQTLRFK